MKKLFVPACGDRITLAAPWSFNLYLEHRNVRFAEARGLYEPKPGERWGAYEQDGSNRPTRLKKVRCELPAGTELEFDRLYIRTFNKSRIQEGDDYDSVTFKVMKNGKAARNQRFWAKLSDVCEIEYTTEVDSLYRDRVKAVREVMES